MSGLVKPKQYKVEDSNIALLGSDLEREVKKAAAETEPAWANAGKKVGLEIWRIEKFNVKSWPKEQYGQFYSGDSYIILNTYLKDPVNNPAALAWDVHFWLGEYTTQDEAGTAAYKTVELDTLLDDAPVQHREVQDHESRLFLSYFKDPIRLLDGGVESGFNHVEPDSYQPRLLHIKGKKHVRVRQVPLSHESLNTGDVFILDKGLHIYQFNGSKAGIGERTKGGQLSRALDDERKGLAEVHVYSEGDADMREFWAALGSEGPIKSAEEGGSDWEAEENVHSEKKLFRLSDASGKMTFTEVASGNFSKDQLDTNDVFIVDSGPEVWAWIGKGASVEEKHKALGFAQDYLAHSNKPAWTPIARIFEGGENEVFEASFN